MDINNLDKNNNIEINNNIMLEEEQKNFIETTIGKVVNTGIDLGIRALLPDFIEEQIINIKDNLFNFGLKDGIKKTINDTIDIGKSAIGIFSGNFENISQMQKAIESGGLIDSISILIENIVNKINQKGIIDNNIANILKQGKDLLLKNIENKIEKTFENQFQTIENLENFINEWKHNFKKQDFYNMEKVYKELERQIKYIAPIENILNQFKMIENLHTLIKNNGHNFNLNEQQLKLAEKLI